MAWRGLPNHTNPQEYAKYQEQNRRADLHDQVLPTRRYRNMEPGWTYAGASNPQNLVPRSQGYIPFQSLIWRDGQFGYTPSVLGYPQYGQPEPSGVHQPQMLTYTGQNIPRNRIVETHMRPQPDYGANGQLYAPDPRIGSVERQYRYAAPANGGGERQIDPMAPANGGSEHRYRPIAPAHGDSQHHPLAPPHPQAAGDDPRTCFIAARPGQQR